MKKTPDKDKNPAPEAEAPLTPAKPPFIDRPQLEPVFADGVRNLVFDAPSRTLRIEFTARCHNAPTTEGRPAVSALPVCRLVLSQDAIPQLLNLTATVREPLLKAGVIAAQAPAAPEKKSSDS